MAVALSLGGSACCATGCGNMVRGGGGKKGIWGLRGFTCALGVMRGSKGVSDQSGRLNRGGG